MDRRVLSACIPSARGRATPASGKPLTRLLPRRGSLSKATTPPERKIRRVVTGIPSISSIPRITTRRIFRDRKSTRLNSSHQIISYAVFCLKKKKTVVRQYQCERDGSRLTENHAATTPD